MKNDVTRVLASNINALMASHRTTQDELGKILGVHQSQISKWVRGQALPGTAQLIMLAKHFGVSIDDLVYDDLTKQNPRDREEIKEILKIVGIIGATEAYRRIIGARPESNKDPSPSVTILKPKTGPSVRKKRRRDR